MGSLERGPVISREAQPGYLEGYLDALAKVVSIHKRKPELSVEDLCMMLTVSVKTIVLGGDIVLLPNDLRCSPSLLALLSQGSSS